MSLVTAAVECRACGHEDEVTGLIMSPTAEIVRAVCDRDPCPACGKKTMEPTAAPSNHPIGENQ